METEIDRYIGVHQSKCYFCYSLIRNVAFGMCSTEILTVGFKVIPRSKVVK